MSRFAIEGGIADSAEKYRVSGPRRVERRVRQRLEPGPQRRTADRRVIECELMAVPAGDSGENASRRGDDLGTDAVTRQQQNGRPHEPYVLHI